MSLRKLQRKHGKLPETVTVRTGRGMHLYFRPGDTVVRNSASRLGAGVDIRGDGGYVVGPGSIHETGALYRFAEGRGLDDVKIARAPKWLREAIEAPKNTDRSGLLPNWTIPSTKRVRAEAYAAAALQRELDRLRKAPKHRRNDTLNCCAFKLGQFLPYALLDRKAIETDLERAALAIGLEEREVTATINSGLNAGERSPRRMPASVKRGEHIAPVSAKFIPEKNLTEELSHLGETDTDNAQRLAARFQDRIIFTKGRGWLVYDGGRWCPEAVHKCIEFAKETARKIRREAKYLADDSTKAARRKFSSASLSKSALGEMLELTKGLVEVEDRNLDADPLLLNVENGTIDLRSGQIEGHDPRDLLTQIAHVVFNSKAKCPIFMSFLKRITDEDKAVKRYMKKCVGYSLTGKTGEQVFFFCYGKSGRNGKSTFVNTVRDMLGDYGCHTPTETLMTKQYDNAISNDQARLAGVRLVTAVEANFNRHLDEAKLKAMTGGEKITARFMRQEYFEFLPRFKLWFVANDRPRVRGTDTALWRRIRVLPFNVEIPEAECDKDLPAKLRAEWPGILAWAVRGCLAWQCEGLIAPSAIRAAGDEWAHSADHLKRFVGEVLIRDPGHRIGAAPLYDSYGRWCSRNGETPLSMGKFKTALTVSHNLTHKRSNQGSQWIDVRLSQ